MSMTLNRREMIAGAAALAGLGLSGSLRSLLAADSQRQYQIGACDWSIGMRNKIESLAVAKRIGLDGVQVTFAPPDSAVDLRDEKTRQAYRDASRETGIAIASLCIGALNQKPYASDPDAEPWVQQCIEVMPKMGQKIVLIPFFDKGDIKGKPDLQDAVIRRFKRVAPQAEKAGVILGIESTLDVDDHLRILDGVGSPAVKVYYDVANMHYAGYDIFKEMRTLGADRICQIHLKERNHLLGNGEVDFAGVRDTIGEIGYDGWLIIEGATERGRSAFDCYVDNQKFVHRLFNGAKV